MGLLDRQKNKGYFEQQAEQKNSSVVVRLVKETDDVTGDLVGFFIQISLKSEAKANRWSHTKVSADADRLQYKVGKLAETLANFQCETYGDRHDPGVIGKAAVSGLADIMAEASRAIGHKGKVAAEKLMEQ